MRQNDKKSNKTSHEAVLFIQHICEHFNQIINYRYIAVQLVSLFHSIGPNKR